MRTRKLFTPEHSAYENVTNTPEPNNNHSKKVAYTYDSYDSYPEKEPREKIKANNFEGIIEIPLIEEYKLQSQIDKHSRIVDHDAVALAALNEEINDLAGKWDAH